jgi:hypothetical protein
MKISVYLKDPDGFSNEVDEAVKKSLADLGLDEDEMEPLIERRTEKVWKQLEKWVEYQEYVGIEFDLEAGTATVQLRKK